MQRAEGPPWDEGSGRPHRGWLDPKQTEGRRAWEPSARRGEVVDGDESGRGGPGRESGLEASHSESSQRGQVSFRSLVFSDYVLEQLTGAPLLAGL